MSLGKEGLSARPVFVRMAALAAFAFAASVGTVHSAEYVMKFSSPTINDPQHEWIKVYKEELEERTNGRISVEIYPGSQLGPVSSVIEGLQLGTIEGNTAPAEFYAGVDYRFQILAVPGLFNDIDEAYQRLRNPDVRDALLRIGEDKGLVGIGLQVYGSQVFATTRPVESLGDLRGLRIRVLASETEMGAVAALGAAPVPMPLNEVQAALQQGAIDGLSSVINPFVALRTYEVAPYVMDTHLWYVVPYAAVSAVWLNTLPEDLQDAVRSAGYATDERIFEYQVIENERSRQNWIEHGGTISFLPDEDQAAAEELVSEVAADFLQNNPEIAELYDLIQSRAER